jgi:hypothetical protein
MTDEIFEKIVLIPSVSMFRLLGTLFQVQADQLAGPDWIKKCRTKVESSYSHQSRKFLF